jgi:hemolysin III
MMSNSDHPSAPHEHHEHFSVPLFILTVVVTLGALFAGLKYLFPAVWAGELSASWQSYTLVFLCVSLVTCFVEYFFHRYVLHTPAVPFLRRLYRQHTLHHALTRIVKRPAKDGRGVLCIENKFPITEPEQGEASFFPWYSLGVFAVILTPLFAGLHLVFPTLPWFLMGYSTLAFSLALYEVLHAINHWPFERWVGLVTNPRWSWFWRPVYGFHLRHHAVTDCNESISGFLGLPVGDWVFGTCMIPQTVYSEGEDATPEKFQSPRPRALIRWLDRVAQSAVARQRKNAMAPSSSPDAASSGKPARSYTRAEEIGDWITHGFGLALGFLAFTFLVVLSSTRGDAWHVVSFSVFGLTLLLLYSFSTLYHAHRRGQLRTLFKRLDRAAIFFLIAGTYTPFLLTSLRGPWAWGLFGIVWGLCGGAAVFTLIFGTPKRAGWILPVVGLTWLSVLAFLPSAVAIPNAGRWLLLSGAICYTASIGFYLWQWLRFHKVVHRTLVLSGSTCHCLAVLFILPSAA